MSEQSQDNLTVLGRITSVYGIKGWVKIYSYTQPMDNILRYTPWQLKINGQWTDVKMAEGKRHGKGIVARLDGVTDRDQARAYCELEIAVDRSLLPELAADEYYWSQLEKLQVYTLDGVLLGKVHHLIETGSNDVLVVRKCEGSLDKRERLIPYLPDQVVSEINLEAGTMRVDWDPEF